jgi:putative two-component system response regulator
MCGMNVAAKQTRETILVVDDTADNLALLNEMLKEHYRVKLAISGEQALEVCGTRDLPDLILLDIMMPKMDGYEVCSRLKAEDRTKDIPVIFISALSELDNVVQGFRAGGVDYITKPFLFEEVFARVQAHIKLRQAQQEIQSLLSKTLTGSIRVMLDVLAMTQPEIVQQSTRLRQYAKVMMQGLPIQPQDAWVIELAAMLVNFGCVSVPSSVLQRKMSGFILTPGEQEKLISFPAVSAEIIGKIPRMEKVAEIIGNQMLPLSEVPGDSTDSVFLGSYILNMVLEYDQMVMLKRHPLAAADFVIARLPDICPSVLVQSLRSIASTEAAKK